MKAMKFYNVLKVMILSFSLFAMPGGVAAEEVDPSGPHDFRWAGKAADNAWNSVENWEMKVGDEEWESASFQPGEGDSVVLGDSTQKDAPQIILLHGEVSVGKLTIEATGERAYTLKSLEEDEPATLVLSHQDPLLQSSDAAQDLVLLVPVELTADGLSRLNFSSENRARVVVGRGLQRDGSMRISGKSGEKGAILELQSRVSVKRLSCSGINLLLNDQRVADDDEELPALLSVSRPFGLSGSARLLVKRAVRLGAQLSVSGTAYMNAYDTGGEDVTFQCSLVRNNGTLRLEKPLNESSDVSLTLKVENIAQAGNQPVPTIHLAENTFIDLGSGQDAPGSVDASGGVHGEGAIFFRSRRRGSATSVRGNIGDQNTSTGGTYIERGTLQLEKVNIPQDEQADETTIEFAGHLGPGMLYVATAAAFDMNGLDQTVSGINDWEGDMLWPDAEVKLDGGRLTIDSTEDSAFSGNISGPGALVKRGPQTFKVSGNYSNAEDRLLRVEDGRFAVERRINLSAGEFEYAGGRIEAANVDLSGQTWNVELGPGAEEDGFVAAGQADIDGARLQLTVENGYAPEAGNQYVLLNTENGIVGADEDIFGCSDGEVIPVGDVHFVLETDGGDAPVKIVLTVQSIE